MVIFEDAAHCIAREAIPPRVDGERARIEVHRVHPVVAQRPRTIHVGFVLGEMPRRRIETMQTCKVGAKPQCPLPVLDQFKIGPASPLRVELINCEASGRRIETIQTIVGGDPERFVGIDEKTCHDVVAQTVWISRIVKVRLEFSRPPVKTEQPVGISSNPEIAGSVFMNRDHIGTGCRSAVRR